MKRKPFDQRLRDLSAKYGPDACWPWPGSAKHDGYGRSSVTVDGVPRVFLVHREAWARLRGPIPKDATLDHLCRNRKCLNPAHLEPVSLVENVMRGESPIAANAEKTHCANGHPYDDENTNWKTDRRGRKSRECISCRREYQRQYYARNAQACIQRVRDWKARQRG